MWQNGTIKRKHPCLLERGSRNCLLLRQPSFYPSFFLFSCIFAVSSPRFPFIRCVSFLFFTLSLPPSRSCFLALLSFLPSTRSSQCTGDVTSIRISYRKKKAGSMGALPPDPNSSASPRYFRSPVLVLPLPTKRALRVFFNYR